MAAPYPTVSSSQRGDWITLPSESTHLGVHCWKCIRGGPGQNGGCLGAWVFPLLLPHPWLLAAMGRADFLHHASCFGHFPGLNLLNGHETRKALKLCMWGTAPATGKWLIKAVKVVSGYVIVNEMPTFHKRQKGAYSFFSLVSCETNNFILSQV